MVCIDECRLLYKKFNPTQQALCNGGNNVGVKIPRSLERW